MPGVTVVGSAAAWATATVGSPAGVAAGNIVLLTGYVRGTGTTEPTGPAGLALRSGWPIVTTGAPDAAHTIRHYLWVGRAPDPPAASYTFDTKDYQFYSSAVLVLADGGAVGDPIDIVEQDLQFLIGSGAALPTCDLAGLTLADLLVYLATDRNDGDITAMPAMTDASGRAWTAQAWHSIGSFTASMAAPGDTGPIHGSGVAADTYGRTAGLLAVRAPAGSTGRTGTATLELSASGSTSAPVSAAASLTLSAGATVAASPHASAALSLSATGSTIVGVRAAAVLALIAAGNIGTVEQVAEYWGTLC